MLTDNSTDPQIENFLNYASMKNLLDLNAIIANEPYALNTRMVKFILNAPHDECRMFLQYQKDVFLHTLYSNAL
jgi:16S rRNA A1518/A1519 N6-dimethyltransferase RsmA/KsgA/DIM1 with predicted DNA glycosylase/AP lyase activity